MRLSDALTPDPAWLCAYLDGDSWSQDGVRLATEEELTNFFGSSDAWIGSIKCIYHILFNIQVHVEFGIVKASR